MAIGGGIRSRPLSRLGLGFGIRLTASRYFLNAAKTARNLRSSVLLSREDQEAKHWYSDREKETEGEGERERGGETDTQREIERHSEARTERDRQR